ncbi:beta-lactamase superfamily domain-containing protein [Tribonema minus]|uniref:Beta-lactamase superfamily domain-containing protein n=1 Tax=Tribonema minus TaxID=303371 RepID=A0A836CLM8_9STRA|nr:beta-lactamase superfamily domain-containing protein [Tribonema minus]
MLSLGAARNPAVSATRRLPEVVADPDPTLDAFRPLEKALAGGKVKFDNPWAPGSTDKSPAQMWDLMRHPQPPYPTPAQVAADLPFAEVDHAAIHSHRAGDAMRVTWIGHATLLVQMGGVNFITDPIFAERCSAVQWAGPKRYTPPAMRVSELPPLDFVLLSHNHYDHLCYETVQEIGNAPLWIVPKGVKRWMRGAGIDHCVEMSWWDHVLPLSDDFKVVCLPSQHWSSRTPWDRNTSLWCSYAAISNGGSGSSNSAQQQQQQQEERFYFGADTALIPRAPVHEAIGARYGPFDVAALPIGAYAPRAFMAAQHWLWARAVDGRRERGGGHCAPDEALQIAADVRARRSVAIHWGTFHLAWEGYADAPRELVAAAAAARSGGGGSGGGGAFEVLRHGESVVRGQPRRYACKWSEAAAASAPGLAQA